MLAIDFSEPRVIGLIVGGSIALISLSAILIRYLVREHKRKKSSNEQKEK